MALHTPYPFSHGLNFRKFRSTVMKSPDAVYCCPGVAAGEAGFVIHPRSFLPVGYPGWGPSLRTIDHENRSPENQTRGDECSPPGRGKPVHKENHYSELTMHVSGKVERDWSIFHRPIVALGYITHYSNRKFILYPMIIGLFQTFVTLKSPVWLGVLTELRVGQERLYLSFDVFKCTIGLYC
jgi:hypothetical protein